MNSNDMTLTNGLRLSITLSALIFGGPCNPRKPWMIQPPLVSDAHKRVRYLARLRYRDAETGARKEKSRTAPSISVARRCLKELEEEFEMGGQKRSRGSSLLES